MSYLHIITTDKVGKLLSGFRVGSIVTVDGTNFRIMEPILFNKDWFSHKFKGPRYAISIRKGYIVSINGPSPAFPDRRI